MKNFSAFILIFLFTIQIVFSGIVTVWYYANQNYIATVLCVNKDKKEMGCNGKCALNKKLSQAENSQDNQAPLTVKKPTEAAPFLIVQQKKLLPEYTFVVSYNQIPASKYQFILSKDIFHPPIISFS